MQHFTPPAPVIATGKVYATYLDAARANLTNLLRLTQGLRDAEFQREAQAILDGFNDAAADAEELIAEANEPMRDEEWWSEPAHAEAWGMGA